MRVPVITAALIVLSLVGSSTLWLTMLTALAFCAAQYCLMSCYDVHQPVVQTFHAFFFIGTACVLTPWMLCISLLFLFHLGVVLRCLTWRVFWAGFIGITMPYVFISAICMWIDDYNYFESMLGALCARPWMYVVAVSALPVTTLLQYVQSFSVWQLVTWAFFTIVGVLAVRHIGALEHKLKIKQRLLHQVVVCNSVALWLLLFFFPSFYTSLIGAFAASISPLVTVDAK